MTPIRIRTDVDSQTIAVLPGLQKLLGKTVEIRVMEVTDSTIDRLLDADCHADCESDVDAELALADVRLGLSKIRGLMTKDYAAEREER